MPSQAKVVNKTATGTIEVPVAARPVISAADVQVPEGYVVEPLIAGLTYANSIAFSPDGTMFICEGGMARPFRPFTGAHVLAVEPNGRITNVVDEYEGPLMGIAWRDGHLYAALDGRPTRIVRYEVGTGKRETVVDGIPGGGTHPINGPVFGPDGMMYFGQGTASLNGVIDFPTFAMGPGMLHPEVHDVPGQDVTLTGHNFIGVNPTKPFPSPTRTGGFKPLGTTTKKGDTVKGQTLCTSSILRANPDGSGVELLAWGIREAFGMAFDERGELYAADNNMDDAGTRPVANDPERIWHIKNAKTPAGTVTTPDWYGWPDYCGDGLPTTDKKHLSTTGSPALPIIENPPRVAGKAAVVFDAHVGVAKMDFCLNDTFGARGDLFLAHPGSFIPMSSPDKTKGPNGFSVSRINIRTGEVSTFMSNKHPGPSTQKGPHGGFSSAGIERPVDCKFGPDGNLYVLDIGRLDTSKKGMVTYGRTGILWRIRPEGVRA